MINDLVYRNTTTVSHETKNGEDNEAEEEACGAVCQRDHYSVSVAFVVELVVAAHCDQRPKTSSKSKQDLNGCIIPNLQN